VTILGANFDGATSVDFKDGVPAVFTVDSSSQITTVVPDGAISGRIKVTTPAGTATSSTAFKVTSAKLRIDSFSPSSGPVGTSVTILGANFDGATSVDFKDGVPAVFTVDSSSQITTVVPDGAISGRIKVTTPAGTATSSTAFKVTSAKLRIDSFSPSSGPVGTSVTILGANFDGATSVDFKDGVPAVFTVDSSSQITTVVPDGAISGRIKVTTPAGTATSSTAFKVVRAPALTSFAPTSGAVGDVVKVSGANFVDVLEVSFGTVAAPFAVVSSATISATVPPGAVTGPITVATTGGSATSASVFSVVHGRTASFRRPKPLVATGTVTVVDGFAPCRQGVWVKVQRKISGTLRTVAGTTTSAAGTFRVRLRNPKGPYRTVLPSQTLPSGDV